MVHGTWNMEPGTALSLTLIIDNGFDFDTGISYESYILHITTLD